MIQRLKCLSTYFDREKVFNGKNNISIAFHTFTRITQNRGYDYYKLLPDYYKDQVMSSFVERLKLNIGKEHEKQGF